MEKNGRIAMDKVNGQETMDEMQWTVARTGEVYTLMRGLHPEINY